MLKEINMDSGVLTHMFSEGKRYCQEGHSCAILIKGLCAGLAGTEATAVIVKETRTTDIKYPFFLGNLNMEDGMGVT